MVESLALSNIDITLLILLGVSIFSFATLVLYNIIIGTVKIFEIFEDI
jgi:hypothetical protein